MARSVVGESVTTNAETETMAPGQALKIIVGAGLGVYLNSASFLVYSFGVFVLPIAAQTGWNRTYIAAAIGPTTLVIGLLCPFMGQLVDRFGAHRFALISFPSLALGLILLGLVPRSPGAFAAVFILAGILSAGQTPVAYSYMVAAWFDARRGLALGVTLAFTGLGISSIPLLAAALIPTFGWRNTYVILGVIVFCAGLPVAHWLVQDPPTPRHGSPGRPAGISLRQASRARPLWTFVAAFFLVAVATGAGIVPFPALLADRGVQPQRAAMIMTVIGLSMIGGRVVVGALFDRLFAPRLAAAVFAAPMLAHVLLATSANGNVAIIAGVLFGLGLGADTDALAYLTSRAFGMQHFGKIYGITFAAFTVGIGAGPALVALLLSHFGRYSPGNWIAATSAGLAAILILTLARKDLPYVRAAAPVTTPGRTRTVDQPGSPG